MSELQPADPFPAIEFSMVGGGTKRVQDSLGKWVMVIVYRGDHCPRCKTYVKKLHTLVDGYAERGVELLLASMDPEHIAQRTIDENSWTLPARTRAEPPEPPQHKPACAGCASDVPGAEPSRWSRSVPGAIIAASQQNPL